MEDTHNLTKNLLNHQFFGITFINTPRGRSVAWSSIGRLGRSDPGSNPGGPTLHITN